MRFIKRKRSGLLLPAGKSYIGCTFQAQKFRSGGVITYQGPEFHNIVLDVGLDTLATEDFGLRGTAGSNSNNASTLNVGTGSSTPVIDQSGLDSYLTATQSLYGSTTHGYDTDDPIHRWSKTTYEFAIGTCTGNLTEVGLSSDVNIDYFNRQLFKDAGDNPITITVASDEGLRVTCTLYLYGDMQPGDTIAGSFLLNGSDTIDYSRELTTDTGWLSYPPIDCMGALFRAVEDGCQLSTLGTGFSGGTDADSFNQLSYTDGDFYMDTEYIWSPGAFIGDISSIYFKALFPPPFGGIEVRDQEFSAFRLTPTITVTDTDEVTITMRRAWARVEESS